MAINLDHVRELEQRRAALGSTNTNITNIEKERARLKAENEALANRVESNSRRNNSDFLQRQIDCATGAVAEAILNERKPNTTPTSNGSSSPIIFIGG
jgi:hypothetical protein